MAIADKTFRFIVSAAPTTALGQRIAGMSAGTWATMSPVPSGIVPAICVGGSMGNMIPFCNAGSWNPISRRIEILGQDHGWGNIRHVQYDEATNAFSFVSNIGTSEGHGYDHYEVNPTNGDLYWKNYAYGNGGSIGRKPYGGSWTLNFSTVPTFQQVAGGSCWWTGAFTGVGAQGAFLIYNTQGDGDIAIYNASSGAWLSGINNAAPGVNSYHGVMAYSAVKNCAVYGGANTQTNRAYRLNSDRTITNMPNTPSGCSIGIYAGCLACDPVTGNFLVLSGGNLFELNPTGAGTWSQLTGSRVPPAGVNNPSAGANVLWVELPDHGALATISASGGGSAAMHLYKHA